LVNTVRADYPWSQRTYDESNSNNVWIIKARDGKVVGFAEIELKNSDFSLDNRFYVYIHELHIDLLRQHAGIGRAVLQHLLKKGLDLEFVIAKCNEKVQGLVSKFVHIEKHETETIKTIRIVAMSNPQEGLADMTN